MRVQGWLTAIAVCVLTLPASSQEPHISLAVPAADDAAEALQVILDRAEKEFVARVEALVAEQEAGMAEKGPIPTERILKVGNMLDAHRAYTAALAVQVLALVKELPDSEIRRKGLEWLLSGSRSRSCAPLTIELLAQEYIEDERLGNVCLWLRDAPAGATLVSTLKGIVQDSPHLEVRGKASWALAQQYKRFAEFATSAPSAGPESRTEVGDGSWDGKFRAQVQLVADKYPDLLVGSKTLGSMAADLLKKYELRQTGTLAPDIEGEDLDGVAFKLSDYRGKVVVLTFWGNW